MHSETKNHKRPLKAGIVLALVALIATPADAATSANGQVSSELDQLIEIEATDAAIVLGAATPSSGSGTAIMSTVDSLVFSNANSNVQAAWDFGLSVAFAKDADGSTVTDGSVSYQGTSSSVQDLVYLADDAAGAFTPWKVVTGSDLSAEATGWTSHADCAASTYKGSFSFVQFDNAGAKQAAEIIYYEVCDSVEIFVGVTKDLTAGDKAIMISQASSGATATAANYEVVLGSTEYVFYSAASASTVTLHRGHHVDLGANSNTEDIFALIEMPDGFPAGSFTATLTASASDINSS